MTAYAARKLGAGGTSTGWRPADLVHALAQLPGRVSLDLEAASTERAGLELLSRAYGLEHRLELSSTTGPIRWRFEGASPEAQPSRTMAELVDSLWPAEVESAATDGDDHVLSGHRIALVTNIPAHYRVPLFNGLATRAARAGALLRVFFSGEPPSAQPWLSSPEGLTFDHEFVASSTLPRWVPLSSEVDRVRPPRIPRGLGRRLRAFAPTMVVGTSFSFSGIAVHRYAARHRVPFGLWNGDVAHQLVNRSYRAPRTRQREWLARRADFGIAYGSLAARYLHDLAPGLPVVIGRNTSVVDVPERREPERRNGLELLAVADLSVPEKGFEIVVEALRNLPGLSCRLSVVGNPPPDGVLARAAARDSRIVFLGPRPHDEVKSAYARSDLFVFPSRMDIFGLALLEAMAAGVPSISSDVPGSVADLVVPQHNCLMAAARDPRSWADAVATLAEAPLLRASVGTAAQATVRRRWTMAHAIEGTMAGFRLGAWRAGGAA